MRFAAAILALAAWLVFLPARAPAQEISGDIGIYSKYLDFDLFVLTDEPVVQAVLYASLTDECSAMAWGSHGLSTRVGGELDLGGICAIPVGQGTVTTYVLRSFLRGEKDVWTIAGGYAIGGADLTVEQYFWDGNPGGTRIIAGYTHQASKRVTVRPMLAYETGLGLPDMLAGGARADIALAGGLGLVALGLVPLVDDKAGLRASELQLGLRYAF